MSKSDLIYRSIQGLAKVTWADLYTNEQAILVDLNKIDVDKYVLMNYKGSQYIKDLQGVAKLTSKQMSQLKRISKWIKLYMIEVEGGEI